MRPSYAAALLALVPTFATAQETVFNVPSPDVLGARVLYLETDQYFTSPHAATRDAFALVRGVLGVGHEVEIGFNAGAFDYRRASSPFADATVKWRLVHAKNTGVIVGDNIGVGVGGAASGTRNLAYGAAFLAVPPTRSRMSAGPYCATRQVFGTGRCGAQVTVEQPLPAISGVELAGDWYSGGGASATVGAIVTVRRLVIYAGYGFANTGRAGDLITLEAGITL
jgi:hypothetical protein